MSKQTAVEWLIEKIYFKQVEVNRELLDQAIEMDKQQKIDAYVEGANNQIYGVDLSGLEYYEKTFNK